jgi:hypothetical protein
MPEPSRSERSAPASPLPPVTDQSKGAKKRTMVVGRTGRVMHIGTLVDLGTGPVDADTLCGRHLFEVAWYPLWERHTLPWDLCHRCWARDAGASSSSSTESGNPSIPLPRRAL